MRIDKYCLTVVKNRIFKELLIFGIGVLLTACANAPSHAQVSPTMAPSPIPQATATMTPQQFDGDRAYQDLKYQVSLGPRTPGSKSHEQLRAWIKDETEKAGWKFETQTSNYNNHQVYNLVAKRGSGHPWIILGAHYDSRFFADQDAGPANQRLAVPGANDGASGVAVLTELARVLPSVPGESLRASQIWLVFFDWEDQGGIDGNNWIVGSAEFAEQLKEKPDAVVVIDMIGDKDLKIYQERNSNQEMNKQIWDTARQLGYSREFIPESKFSMIDDHTPFLNAGIPAVDLIDFEYPFWHTLGDVPNNVSAESLEAVGDTLYTWLKQKP